MSLGLANQSASVKPVGDPHSLGLSVVTPVHNEGSTVRAFLLELNRTVHSIDNAEIIVCEDGSEDNTRRILMELKDELGLRLCLADSRRGYGRAAAEGLALARSNLIFFTDSDGQYNPRELRRLYECFLSGGFDMVIGRKVHRRDSLLRVGLARGFHSILRALFGIRLVDIDCGFRIIDRKLVQKLLPINGLLQYSFWAEFTIRGFVSGARIAEVPISHSPRVGTTRIYSPKKLPLILLKQLRGLFILWFATSNGR